MPRRRLLALAFVFAFFSQAASAMTLHFEMTPELAGEKGVTMRSIDEAMTRFTICISAKNDSKAVDPLVPFVRRGSLDVRGKHGRVLRCSIHPKEQGHDLLYTFDLENEHAIGSCFVLVEHFDDGQVGGGRVFSYRLIDFIYPEHRAKELLQGISPPDLSKLEILSVPLLSDTDESDSP